jgi:hypothetical protein
MPPEPKPDYLAWIRSRPGWHSTAEIWQAHQRAWDKDVAEGFCQWRKMSDRHAIAIPAHLYVPIEEEVSVLGNHLQDLLQAGHLMVYYKGGSPMWQACEPTYDEE